MAVNTDPFSDPFGSKEVEVGRDSLFALFFLDPPRLSNTKCVCMCVFGERQRQWRQCHHCRRGRITLAPVRVRGHVISAI